MKRITPIPVLGILAVFACSPLAASAQASNPGSAVYADLAAPAANSSSSLREDSPSAPASSAAASASAPAPAPDAGEGGPFSGLGVGVKVGVAGIGFDVATPIVPTRLNLRGGATFFSYNLNEATSDGETINGTLKLQNSGIMVDWFPWHGSFRLSGGATVYNNKGVSGTADVAGGKSFTLGNDKYYSDPNNPTVGTVAVKLGGNAGGRVSFGWGNLVPKKGHHFSFDTELGIEFVSKPTFSLTFSSACTGTNGEGGFTGCGSQVSAADIAAEDSKYQSDVNFLSFYPIISVGVGYRIH